jgi:hypothetical protein
MILLNLYSGIVSPHLDEKINDFMLSVCLVSVLVALDCHSLGGYGLCFYNLDLLCTFEGV